MERFIHRLTTPVVLGVVGGIGAGKSFVSCAFVANGAALFDADREAKKLFEENDFIDLCRARWSEVVDESNAVDFRKLAEIVFAPSSFGQRELDYLNSIVRPRVLRKFQEWIADEKRKGTEIAVLDAPLLLEAGWDSLVDYLVFVDASFDVRLQRVLERGWDRDELIRREARQMDLNQKKERSTFTIVTDASESDVRERVVAILDAVRNARKNA